MTLIKSISGIRGTIGGRVNDNLTPIDAVLFASAYGSWLQGKYSGQKLKVVIGRDARPSGEMIQGLVQQTLVGMGIDVYDAGLSTTPTVEMAVVFEGAQGGVILTASHNPVQWNALKLLNERGEFISGDDGKALLDIIDKGSFSFAEVQDLGKVHVVEDYIDRHIEAILKLPYINPSAIAQADLHVAIDAVNSTGGIAIPRLLAKLGVKKVQALYCEPNGQFPHNPEPLREHLGDIMQLVREKKCDLGVVVDPDVDRLALISEDGEMFGEEYTLVACADYLLEHKSGPLVSNLSSSRALRDLAEARGVACSASAVGEVNVVTEMKRVNAVLGGEGNGGVILPDLHYGRDSLVGIALVLSLLATRKQSLSSLRKSYPAYYMGKNKIALEAGMPVDDVLKSIAERYSNEDISTIDGVKINFAESWVHLRKSNTEPIIRIYTEAKSQSEADALGEKYVAELKELAYA